MEILRSRHKMQKEERAVLHTYIPDYRGSHILTTADAVHSPCARAGREDREGANVVVPCDKHTIHGKL